MKVDFRSERLEVRSKNKIIRLREEARRGDHMIDVAKN